MGLGEYHRKRDFAKTPEPRGREHKRPGWSFVVQKHAATRLHYDFRLELEGVLKSWAVPKGPSYDPAEKRLAMQTEDHPIEYGDFEGIIPKGEYGGGTVLLWDRGTWEPIGEDVHRAFREGRLKFRLRGEKLEGAWTLVKIRGRDPRDAEKTWLLIKEKDELVRPASEFDVTAERPESAASGRTLEEIAAEADRVWHSNRPASAAATRLEKAAARLRRKPAARALDLAARAASLPGARKAALPNALKPQLATLVSRPPPGDDWLHEMKFDGYRILARLQKGKARLISRNGKDWTDHFNVVAERLAALPVREALLDGEVAVVLPDGRTSFNALQNAMAGGGRLPLVYFAFDLLHLEGYDLTRVPLEERKAALKQLLDAGPPSDRLRFSDHVIGDGERFFEQACRMGLEGIVSKRRQGAHDAGRGRTWLKTKCLHEQEFVVGGFTDPEGSRQGLGALLLGVHDPEGRLVYVGKVGTGFTEKLARELRQRLDRLEQREIPFASRPPGTARAHWVRPEMVVEVKFTEWTPDGRLRHPSFVGVREDKPARSIVREEPAALEDVAPDAREAREAPRRSRRSTRKPARSGHAPAERTRRKPAPKKAATAPPPVDRPLRSAERPPPSAFKRSPGGPETQVAGVRLTNPDRVMFPDQGLTKRDLAVFYESIAGWILPHLAGRPTTLVRCPEGLAEPCFYQKHTGWWAPKELRRVKIQEKTKVGEYLVVDDLPGLVGLVQIGILEIHTWNSVVEHLERPDRVVFDLDPDPALPFSRVVEAARLVRDRLRRRGLTSFVKTTGGKGLHVVVPIARGPSWEEGAAFASGLAVQIAGEQPQHYTADMSKARRTERIYIDYLRNVRGSTSVAAFSTRAKPGAPVSVPLEWEELDARRGSDFYTVRTLPGRLASRRRDPWAEYWTIRQKLPRS